MSQNFGCSSCPVEAWRLIWLMGIIFAVIITYHHFVLPYGNGNTLLSLSSAHKDPVAGNSSSLLTEASVSALPPLNSSPNTTFLSNAESNVTNGPDKDGNSGLANNGKSGELQTNLTLLQDNSSATSTVSRKVKKRNEKPIPEVISISEMKNLLFKGWSSPNPMRPRWSSAVNKELLNVKSQVRNPPIVNKDPILYAPLYWNVSMFKRSYELMEEKLKVYVYREGEKPILHDPYLSGIYSAEGWFMKLLEVNNNFVTKNPRKAHLFYLPFSSKNLVITFFGPNSHGRRKNVLVKFLKNYLDMIRAKYPFWNRTKGADHFLVACHDWAPSETEQLMGNCIRSLCSAEADRGFVFGKDVSLPQTNIPNPKNPLQYLGGKPASQRSILAFFAGSMHGNVRSVLLQHWRNKDPDMKIFGPEVRDKINYAEYMQNSKYCICVKGYKANSPRVTEAIFHECVPVIISDNYVPPFLEVLNWESFAVFVLEKDIPNLKNILHSIPKKRYVKMQMRVKRVQRHFLWHHKPVKYDLFHMILHSVWYSRVFQMWPMD